ncbi:MAG: serine protease [Bdellovibrio sp.]|nr:serine protease [Bdellovibrio sp.]
MKKLGVVFLCLFVLVLLQSFANAQDSSLFALPGVYVRKQVADTRAFPNRAVGLVINGEGETCTGTLVGARYVLTAAHCVYSTFEAEWATNVRFIPAVMGEGLFPYRVFKWNRIFIPRRYYERANKPDNEHASFFYDYALIELKEPAGEYLGYFGLRDVGDGSSLEGRNITITGYPGDKPFGTMWTVECPVKRNDWGTLDYYCDTFPGMSGSSIRANIDGKDVVVGVSAWGASVPDGVYAPNGGTMFNSENFQRIKSWLSGAVTDSSVMHASRERTVEVWFKNSCSKTPKLRVMGVYLDPETGLVQNALWQELPYGQTRKFFSVSAVANAFHYSAQGKEITWGADVKYSVDGKLTGFNKKVFSEDTKKYGVLVQELTCKNRE